MDGWSAQEVGKLFERVTSVGWPVMIGVAVLIAWWMWCWSRRKGGSE